MAGVSAGPGERDALDPASARAAARAAALVSDAGAGLDGSAAPRIPFHFEPATGAQADAGALFRLVGAPFALEARNDGLWIAARGEPTLHLTVPGADWSTAEGAVPLASVTRDLRAGAAAGAGAIVPHFARLHFPNLLPGLDLVLYENAGSLEYDLLVLPGADPAAFRLVAAGAGAASAPAWEIQRDGSAKLGALTLAAPVAYQDGPRTPVRSAFDADGSSLGFKVGRYDASRMLTIDPIITYGSYLPNDMWGEFATAVALDPANEDHAYVVTAATGWLAGTPGTYGTTAPNAANPWEPDVMLSKFDLSQSGPPSLVWLTYIGGATSDYPADVAVDEEYVYVVGMTATWTTPYYPTTSNAFQTQVYGDPNYAPPEGFLSALTKDGVTLVYSTAVGGDMGDAVSTVEALGNGRVAIAGGAGASFANQLQGKNGFQNSIADPASFGGGPTGSDAFVAVIDVTKTGAASLEWLTFVGGEGIEGIHDMVTMPDGNFLVAGAVHPLCNSGCEPFPARPDAYRPATTPGDTDGFVAVIPGNGGAGLPQLPFSTLVRGSSFAQDVVSAVDYHDGKAYIAGATQDSLFPTTPGSAQAVDVGSSGEDLFVAVLDLSQTGSAQWLAATYWDHPTNTATSQAFAYDIVVDSRGRPIVTGAGISQTPAWAPAPVVPSVMVPEGLPDPLSGTWPTTDLLIGRFSADLANLEFSAQWGDPNNYDDNGYGLWDLSNPNQAGFHWTGSVDSLALTSEDEVVVASGIGDAAPVPDGAYTSPSWALGDGHVMVLQKAPPKVSCQAPAGGNPRGTVVPILGTVLATDAPLDASSYAWWFDYDAGNPGPPDLVAGAPAFSLTPTHVYPLDQPAGDKVIALQAYDTSGQHPDSTLATCKVRVVNAPPVARIGADDLMPYHPATTRVFALDPAAADQTLLSHDPDGSTLTGELEFYWSLPGAATCSVGANPWEASCDWTAPGAYTFGLAVVDQDGAGSFALLTVNVGEPEPVANFDAIGENPDGQFFACAATRAIPFVDLSVKDRADIVAWSWDFDADGREDSDLREPTWAFPPGLHPVTLTVTDGEGFQDTETKALDVLAVAPPAITARASIVGSVYAGAAITFRDDSVAGPGAPLVHRQWYLDDVPHTQAATFTHSFAEPGRHQFLLEIEDGLGCRRIQELPYDVLDLGAQVKETPLPPVEAPSAAIELLPAFARPGEPVWIRDASTPREAPLAYRTWDLGDGTDAGEEAEVVHRYSEPGTYVVGLRVTDTAGLSDAAAAIVTVLEPGERAPFDPQVPAPVADAGADILAYAGSAVALDGRGSIVAPLREAGYRWEQLQGPPVSLTGTATVAPAFLAPAIEEEVALVFRLTVSDGVHRSQPDHVTVVVAPRPPVAFDAHAARGGEYQFVPHGAANGTARWDFGDGTTATGDVVRHTFPASGTYTVTLETDEGRAEMPLTVDVRDGATAREREPEAAVPLRIAGLGVYTVLGVFLATAALCAVGWSLLARRR